MEEDNRFRAMLRALARSAGKWRLFVGRDPEKLPRRSIVLLPVQPGVLFCGLAGILVIKGGGDAPGDDVLENLSRRFDAVRSRPLKRVLGGETPPDGYLHPEELAFFEKDVYSLKQDPRLQWMLGREGRMARLKTLCSGLSDFAEDEERLLEKRASAFPTHVIEKLTHALILLKDIAWALKEDVLANQEKISALAGNPDALSQGAFEKYQRLNFTLNALDRLEVRGRDSCGVQAALHFSSPRELRGVIEKIKSSGLYDLFMRRCSPGDLMDRSIHVSPETLIFTYKTALITGDLGDNTRYLRKSIREDPIIHLVMEHAPDDSQMYLAHTRWASVGAINEANCHPVNNFISAGGSGEEWDFSPATKKFPFYGSGPWAINVVLNGDIDNYPSLKDSLESNGWRIDSRVSTDTKVIPLQIEKYLLEGHDLKEAFRRAVCDFEGSHAIAVESNLEPGRVFLALKGSGQTIYVGICERQYVFSSEVYGLVEETPDFIKMDGERQRIPGDERTRGQIFVLSNTSGGGLEGIEAMYYDGHPLRLGPEDVRHAEITTRDIDRGAHPHFLLKEIMDSPQSIRKTMRGKYRIEKDQGVVFNLDEAVFPRRVRDALVSGEIRHIYVVGQGTAAVAGAAVAEALSFYLKGTRISVQARKASDLSGFCLDDDMGGCLVIAITQSGTTTDTNRAVAMARERGAHLIAIVNRRQSDITTKVDGVFYTSDGRDIEMSVASTKAFYSQITAGYLLALFMARMLGTLSRERIAEELFKLEQAPKLMQKVIDAREAIRSSAWDLVRKKRYWAVVGSGANKTASDEIRIKLSELCYKTISSDIIEDKKHIDLSSEPLILVCAAGSPDIVLEDVAKDVAIFNAHASSVAVIADEGDRRFDRIAESVIHVPRSSFPLSVILNTLAGHIWGYYAACSLDAQAGAFKAFRSSLSGIMRSQEKKGLSLYESIEDRELRRCVDDFSELFNSWRRSGQLTSMNVDTASDITLLLKYAVGKLPIEDFWSEFGEPKVTASPLDRLDMTLGRAVEELSRPVDAIRHQAKTVTVGTSRRIEAPRGLIFDALEDLSFTVENIPAKGGIALKRLQDAVLRINGYTLYAVQGLDEEGSPTERSTIRVIRKQGTAEGLRSRFDETGPLMGTKKTIVRTGDVYAGLGKSDRAPIVIVPLLNPLKTVEHLLLLHVEYDEAMDVERKKEILGEKFGDIKNLIDEYNVPWSDGYLKSLPVGLLLGEDVEVIKNMIFEQMRNS
ncbi:MAG TPA: SIS domain-containing protein [Deltaproteobacteria bacterium]|jgi:glucosamine--fructose-6-phosphate aminotransferase (isomerizing)|nr:SIS domain-containing protein [Deltaproteobacteria bacterium]